MKKVEVTATLGTRFRVQCTAGAHIVPIDQPKAAMGEDTGPTSLDLILAAHAGCLATMARIVATQRRIVLRGFEAKVSGELDVDYLLGKTAEGRCGFVSLQVEMRIDADLTEEQKREFAHEVDRRCPVSDNLRAGTPMELLVG